MRSKENTYFLSPMTGRALQKTFFVISFEQELGRFNMCTNLRAKVAVECPVMGAHFTLAICLVLTV